MQNLHDDNLDHLSRKAAEQYEPDQELHSWQKLHPKLDAALPHKKERKRRFLIIFLLFLLVGGGVVFSGILDKKEPTASIDKTDKTKDQTVQKTNTSGDQNTTIPDNQQTETNEQPKNPESTNTSPNNTAVKEGTTVPNKTDNVTQSQINKQQPIIVRQNTSRPQTDATFNNNTRRNTTRNNTPIQQNQKPGAIAGLTSGNETADAVAVAKIATPDKMDPEGIPITETVKNTGKPTLADNTSKAPPAEYFHQFNDRVANPKKNNKPRNRWEFGLTYAPDISTVKFSHTQPPGHNLGITIGYNISKRFSVQTGFIYTTKNYKMNGSEYNPPKGYWTDYVKLETVTGECSMWDIPLNLRYNIAPRKKSNFFASSGLSSYLMQKEDYDFFYYYNGNPVNRYRSMDTTRRHWMSVLNISVGYERQIGKTLSLQVEPFFKQPLTGVGFGSMKLNSTGVYFTLKYKPLSGRLSP